MDVQISEVKGSVSPWGFEGESGWHLCNLISVRFQGFLVCLQDIDVMSDTKDSVIRGSHEREDTWGNQLTSLHNYDTRKVTV